MQLTWRYGLFIRSKMISLLLSVLMWSVCLAEWTPTGVQSWQDGTKGKHTVGGLFNYQKPDSSWAIIDSVWEASGDTAWVNDESYLKSMIWPDGRTRMELDFLGHSITIEQQLLRFSFVDTVTWKHKTIINVDFDDVIEQGFSGRNAYTRFSGWTSRVRLGEHGAVAYIIAMKPAFLDSICVLYDGLSPAAKRRVALATIYKVNVDLDDSVFLNNPRTWGKRIKKCGKFVYQSRPQYLHFPGYDTLTHLIEDANGDTVEVDFRVRVMQEWKKINGQLYMAEYLMMKPLDSIHTALPTTTLWHAASQEMTDNDVSDTYINGGPQYVCYNYGDYDYLWVTNGVGSDQKYSFARCWNVEDIVRSDTFTACTLTMELTAVTTAATVDCREMLKYSWVEGDDMGAVCTDSGAVWAFWNGYSSGRFCLTSDGSWATNGAQCKDADGEYNNNGFATQSCGVDSVADSRNTPMSSVSCSSAPSDIKFGIDASVANWWFDNEDKNAGVILQTATSSGEVRFNSSEIS